MKYEPGIWIYEQSEKADLLPREFSSKNTLLNQRTMSTLILNVKAADKALRTRKVEDAKSII